MTCWAGKTYVQNTYDTTELGTQGSSDFPVGHLTQSVATTYYPEGTSASTTEKFQHDKRRRVITEQLSLGLPSAWNVTTALPTYQVAISYNDADQVTTTTTSTIPNGQGFTTTLAYDSTGAPYGLSNNTSSTPNLATAVYNARALLDTIHFLTSTSSALADDQFGYDANLRVTSTTATWGGGSGNPSGSSIFSQSGSYDNAGNATSLSTTQAAVPGQSGSGGSETQNFCYDEQNRLVWAGNSGTQPAAGNGTCGGGTLASGLSGASYSNSFVYTHLGQLWQGPLAGGSTQYQYLYCDSSHPHELTGLYATSATCSNKTGQGYATSYDAFGNVTGRTFSGTTGTLSYDNFNQFTEWNAGATNQEWYVYDAVGDRVLRRSTNGSGTTLTVYAFGLEEHVYSSTGTNQWNTYYYSLGGQLLGSLDGNGTRFYLTDTLGSILANITNAAGGASVKGNQVFGPYGHARYFKGDINTAKGFTGQYNDGLTGLDYYGARYYDPAVGVFLSADTVQGNVSGENPYAYVGGNPETFSDPTGQILTMPCPNCFNPKSNSNGSASLPGWAVGLFIVAAPADVEVTGAIALILGLGWLYGQLHHSSTSGTVPRPTSTPTPSTGCCAIDVAFQNNGTGISIQPHTSPPPTQTGSSGGGIIPPPPVSAPGAACSFTSDTRVRTQQGEKAIGKLHVGDKVLAYNPKTHKMEQEPVLHVWINHDTDLVDLTLTTTNPAQHGKVATKMSETIHTNQKHPFLTEEKGFLPVGQIKLGMHVLRADGTYGVVTSWKVVPGTQVMYNLEVAQDHTFTVGDGQWVVHNSCGSGNPHRPDQVSQTVRDLAQITDDMRAASGTVRMSQESGKTPNFAAINITSSETGSISEGFESLRSQNNDDPHFDAEQLGVNWATDTLNEYARSGIQAEYEVTLVTQYFPCDFCQDFVDAKWWLENLEAGANGKVYLRLWHYTDEGQFIRFWPGRP